ncbi:MarR family winged helix-turn-helix transcriptional regulator [Streptomyces beihaiensis]|uniref:MarR family transcriptional regulator n=1 Tax=Streptomyces beihaiensis TaxID=2984495 RepID=A0ABT3U1J3_9ACTN|nr:MarR family transcriptional regulator [Streptomyces beihaiensis]MCX3063188.1 MarR family transcriptional regulator [Streptomyces beihaiensis]
MATERHYDELARQLSAFGAVKRDMARILPSDCPPGSAAVLTLLKRYGNMRMSRMAELLAVDVSVASRHVAHVAARGWIARNPDPADKRSRILTLTDDGCRQLEVLNACTTKLLAERLSDWTDDEVDQLIALMTRLRDSFGDCRTTAVTAAARAPA